MLGQRWVEQGGEEGMGRSLEEPFGLGHHFACLERLSPSWQSQECCSEPFLYFPNFILTQILGGGLCSHLCCNEEGTPPLNTYCCHEANKRLSSGARRVQRSSLPKAHSLPAESSLSPSEMNALPSGFEVLADPAGPGNRMPGDPCLTVGKTPGPSTGMQ